jgi:hypothetical protein
MRALRAISAAALMLAASCEARFDPEPAVRAHLDDLNADLDNAALLRSVLDGLPLTASLEALKAHVRATAPTRVSPPGCLSVTEVPLTRDAAADAASGLRLAFTGCRDAVGPGGVLGDGAILVTAATGSPERLEITFLQTSQAPVIAGPSGGPHRHGTLTIQDGDHVLVLVRTEGVDIKGFPIPPDGRELRVRWGSETSCLILDGDIALAYTNNYSSRLRAHGLRVCRDTCFAEGRAQFEYAPRPFDGTFATGEITPSGNAGVNWTVARRSGVVESACN